MSLENNVEFWVSVVPIAFAALLSLALYIVRFAGPFKEVPEIIWWPVYMFVLAVFGGLFAAVGTGLRNLAGFDSDPAYVYFSIFGLVGYLILVAYVPVSIVINKVLAHRYPLPWEKRKSNE